MRNRGYDYSANECPESWRDNGGSSGAKRRAWQSLDAGIAERDERVPAGDCFRHPRSKRGISQLGRRLEHAHGAAGKSTLGQIRTGENLVRMGGCVPDWVTVPVVAQRMNCVRPNRGEQHRRDGQEHPRFHWYSWSCHHSPLLQTDDQLPMHMNYIVRGASRQDDSGFCGFCGSSVSVIGSGKLNGFR